MFLLKIVVVLISVMAFSASPIEYSSSPSPSPILSDPTTTPAPQLHNNSRWTVEACISGVVQRAEDRRRNCPCGTDDMAVWGELSIVKNGRVSCCLRYCSDGDTPLTTAELKADAQFCCEGVRRLLVDRLIDF